MNLLTYLWKTRQDLNFGQIVRVYTAVNNAAEEATWKERMAKIESVKQTTKPKPSYCPLLETWVVR